MFASYWKRALFAGLSTTGAADHLATSCGAALRYAAVVITGRSNQPKSFIETGPLKSGWSGPTFAHQTITHQFWYIIVAEILFRIRLF